MKVDLNLASRPLLDRSPAIVLLATLMIGAVVATAYNAVLWLRIRSEARAVVSQLDELDRRETELTARRVALLERMNDTDLFELDEQVFSANSVLSERALSWTLLLERLQELTPWKVRLDAIRTTVQGTTIGLDLDIRTREHDYYLDFVEKLEEHACFGNVYPSSRSRNSQGELEVTLRLEHDPWCGRENPAPDPREGARRRRGGRRG